MQLKFYLMVFAAAIIAAALTIWVASILSPGAIWAGPGMMAILAIIALAAHIWIRRR